MNAIDVPDNSAKPALNGVTEVDAARATPRGVETFFVRKTLAGWRLVPHNPAEHPLLARLFGTPERDGRAALTLSPQDFSRSLQWASLAEGVHLIRGVAKDCGLRVRVCGNLRKAPVVQLWEAPRVQAGTPRRIFEGIGTDAAKWSVSDFYAEQEQRLRQALSGRQAFDTGWFGVKKEPQSARVVRWTPGGVIHVEVSCSMDDVPELLDTALWIADGKARNDGFDTLRWHGLTEQEAGVWMNNKAEAMLAAGVRTQTQASMRVAHNAGYDRVCGALDELAACCEAELTAEFDALVEQCREELKALDSTAKSSEQNRSDC